MDNDGAETILSELFEDIHFNSFDEYTNVIDGYKLMISNNFKKINNNKKIIDLFYYIKDRLFIPDYFNFYDHYRVILTEIILFYCDNFIGVSYSDCFNFEEHCNFDKHVLQSLGMISWKIAYDTINYYEKFYNDPFAREIIAIVYSLQKCETAEEYHNYLFAQTMDEIASKKNECFVID